MTNILDTVLNDLEKEKIQTFLADTVMTEAVRKVLLSGIYYNGIIEAGKPVDPTQNFLLQWAFQIEIQGADVSDEKLGADFRAEVKSIRKVEQAFQQLTLYVPAKTPDQKLKKSNKAY